MLRSIISQISRGGQSHPTISRVCSRFSSNKPTPEDAGKGETGASEGPKEEDPPKERQFICVEKDGPITIIGINRPEHRNAINSAAASQLCEAIDNFEADETSTVGVLFGLGGSFCSGYEINELGGETINTDILMRAEGSVGPTRRHLKKPMVCGINGYCVANGLELALLCDLRVMEESAILGFFNRRIGVPVIDGGTVRLPAMIGLSRALDLILTGRRVSAKEAFDYGIANRIVATGTACGQALNLAQCIAKFPQAALRHDRNSLYGAVYDSPNFDTSLQNEIMYTSKEVLEEMKDGITKYIAGAFRSGKSDAFTKESSMADWEKEEISREQQTKPRGKKTDEDSKKE